jgi:hypothetical protein
MMLAGTGRKLPALVSFDEETEVAAVLFGGQRREWRGYQLQNSPLFARKERCVRVFGFASQLHSSSKLWDTAVTFYEKEPGVWRFEKLDAGFKPPDNGDPPRIVGFIEGVSSEERGIGHWRMRDFDITRRRLDQMLGHNSRTKP